MPINLDWTDEKLDGVTSSLFRLRLLNPLVAVTLKGDWNSWRLVLLEPREYNKGAAYISPGFPTEEYSSQVYQPRSFMDPQPSEEVVAFLKEYPLFFPLDIAEESKGTPDILWVPLAKLVENCEVLTPEEKFDSEAAEAYAKAKASRELLIPAFVKALREHEVEGGCDDCAFENVPYEVIPELSRVTLPCDQFNELQDFFYGDCMVAAEEQLRKERE